MKANKIDFRHPALRGVLKEVANSLGIDRNAAYMRYRRGDLVVKTMVLEIALPRLEEYTRHKAEVPAKEKRLHELLAA